MFNQGRTSLRVLPVDDHGVLPIPPSDRDGEVEGPHPSVRRQVSPHAPGVVPRSLFGPCIRWPQEGQAPVELEDGSGGVRQEVPLAGLL
jgi:hypothetical protein